jgi:hypothetical protein
MPPSSSSPTRSCDGTERDSDLIGGGSHVPVVVGPRLVAAELRSLIHGRRSCATVWLVSAPWTSLSSRRSIFGCCLSWSSCGLERRRMISLSVTDLPTAVWIARQITEAFPWDPSYTRPGRLLWPCRNQASGGDGHPGSPDCAAVTLAEWTCGEADWPDPSRMSGSHRHLWRSPPASSA